MLFIYFWTNPRMNAACCYIIPKDRAAREAGFRADSDPAFRLAMKDLGARVIYFDEHGIVWVKNYIKRQTSSPRYFEAVAKCLRQEVPQEIAEEVIEYNRERGLEIPMEGMPPSPLPRRAIILLRDEFTCGYCGREILSLGDYDIDRLVPKTGRGSDFYINLLTICQACNQKKQEQEELTPLRFPPPYSGRHALLVLSRNPIKRAKLQAIFPQLFQPGSRLLDLLSSDTLSGFSDTLSGFSDRVHARTRTGGTPPTQTQTQIQKQKEVVGGVGVRGRGIATSFAAARLTSRSLPPTAPTGDEQIAGQPEGRQTVSQMARQQGGYEERLTIPETAQRQEGEPEPGQQVMTPGKTAPQRADSRRKPEPWRQRPTAGQMAPENPPRPTWAEEARALQSIPGYPFDEREDRRLMDSLAEAYGQLDLAQQIREMKVWLVAEGLLPLRGQVGPRKRVRNWMQIADRKYRGEPVGAGQVISRPRRYPDPKTLPVRKVLEQIAAWYRDGIHPPEWEAYMRRAGLRWAGDALQRLEETPIEEG